MNIFLFSIFILAALGFFYLFIRGPYKHSPMWLMLSAWMVGVGVPLLNLSEIEKPWTTEYWLLVLVSLLSFVLGHIVFSRLFVKMDFLNRLAILTRNNFKPQALRYLIYFLFFVSLFGLYKFYKIAGNFAVFASDPDVFRFAADDQVPGLYNYLSQLARLYLPLSAFLIFWEGFKAKKHWDLILIMLFGVASLLLFTSRTQIFFIDLWIMALYLIMRKPNLKQAVKFYPIFLLVSVLVLALVPMYRQYKSYGSGDYLAGITVINSSNYGVLQKALLPIYVGVSFNQQALLHAQQYYETHDIQMGRVTLDPFTNIVGLDNLKSNFDLCEIFECWWNTGTYLFPFVQDFGNSAFYFVPFLIAGILTLLWRYWQVSPNYLSINLYAYACFFIVMTIYLSFTVRAEMYIDLFVIFISYLIVTSNVQAQTK